MIGIENIYFILPIIHDWNSKFKIGETTKYSSKIALQYYQWAIEKKYFFSHDDIEDRIFQTILYGASEIKNELKDVFEEILKNKWKNHRDHYFELSKTVLTKFEGISVSHILPECVLQLANLFWSYTPKNEDRFFPNERLGVEQYFGLEDEHLDYHPASSYQTPIYWLLQSSMKATIDFILEFTSKAVESFAKSKFAKYEVSEVEVRIDKDTTIKQYICDRLWCTYRGTQVSPHVLESIHMALEKFILERGENTESETLEYWLLYLLSKSKSASISAVVASIVLKFPDKTFNVAKILFQTKEFFLFETRRLFLDQGHKSQLLMLKNNFGSISKNDIHENERLKACDDKHRTWTLESLFLYYQCFRNENISEQEAEKRPIVLWEILDDYYKKLPPESKQTETDETWRLYLARMDRRKMNPTTRLTDDGVEINWNPEVEPKLKKKSEDSQKELSEKMKYSSLQSWAYYKMKNDDQYKKYEKYENNPKLALEEVKEVISQLKSIKKPHHPKKNRKKDEDFHLFNDSIPGEVCSVLIRDYIDIFSKKEMAYCKDVILTVASSSLRPHYQYQISDGVGSAISVLPLLIKNFLEEKEIIKTILLLTLFDSQPIGMYGEFSYYPIRAILNDLWNISFDDAQSILLGYLLLTPKYEELITRLHEENYKKGVYELHQPEIINELIKENETDLKRVINNELSLNDITDIEKIELSSLRTAFQLIPLDTENEEQKEIVKRIIRVFAEKLLSYNREDKIDYNVRHDFLEKLAYFVLSAQKHEIPDYLKPFFDNFNASEKIADLFKEFILVEDRLNNYDNFWQVWSLFKGKVVGICKDGDTHWYTNKIVMSYLFAQVQWKETTTSWHTLKDDDKRFFKEISQIIGHCTSTFYAISKLLNDIGSPYLNDGIVWISDMLIKNKNLYTVKLEESTIYYLENLVRKYIYDNREKIRKAKKQKEDVLVILEFLITKGSVIGYILRESIL